MKLAGRTALVTGADSGIGQAIAITFAREGADLVVHYHADEQGAQTTAGRIREHGRRVEIIQADLSDPQVAQSLFQQAQERVGQIDILVNNDGTGAAAEQLLGTALDQFIKVLNIDLVSPWALCQATARHIVERGRGATINTASVHEEIPSPGGAAYDAAKAGLCNITRSLVLELAPKGLRINNIGTGMMAMPMTAETLEDPEQAQRSIGRIPLGCPG